MTRRLVIAGAAVLAAAWAVAAAPAPAEDAGPKTVHFAVCTEAGVEAGCIVAKGDDGLVYNVTNAAPGLKPNQWLQGQGTIVRNVFTFCMQGAVIHNFVPDKEQKPADCGG